MLITFARQTSYSLTVKKTSPARGLFFTVTLECYAPLNTETGMSVDLPEVEKALVEVFKYKTCESFDLDAEMIQAQSKLAQWLMPKHQIVSLRFEEARGWGANLEGSAFQYFKIFQAEIEGRVCRVKKCSSHKSVWDLTETLSNIGQAEEFMAQNHINHLVIEELGCDRVLEWQV